ncbi:nitroreductase family protein [uncultured Methanobrevibacter sp.]|uniref:nitroreductase family protein n=1 Tax=uncultured Methanobrevibacter sp. TaxID=253161 RepID=UPI002632CDA1|nr:nitroreductase family protein [uncultured Methanobrevibacter sp.]
METLEVINKRKSIRAYKNKQISEDELNTIIGVANKAPNAGLFQVTVIQNSEFLKEINDKTKEFMLNSEGFMRERALIPGYEPLYGAPTLIVISAPDGPFTQINVSAAATTMILAATDLNVGTCYVVSPIPILTQFKDKLNIPEGFVPISGILIGYEDECSIPSPEREIPDNINFIG